MKDQTCVFQDLERRGTARDPLMRQRDEYLRVSTAPVRRSPILLPWSVISRLIRWIDRPVKLVETHATSTTTTTDLVYVGLSDAVARETLTGAVASPKTYAYDALGRRATLANGASRYSYLNDPHGSVSLLVDQSRVVKESYEFTGYGSLNTSLSKSAAGFNTSNAPPTNAYRYTAKRWDSGSSNGARRYSASTGRFLQRDAYNDALANLELSSDPLTGNRYALAAGNPVNFVEVDGHVVRGDGSKIGGGATPPAPRSGGRRASTAPTKWESFVPSSIETAKATAKRPVGRSGETTRGLQALQKKIDRGDAEFKGLKKTTNQALELIESVMKKPASVRVGTKWIDIFDAKGRGVRIDALSGKFDTFLSKARVK